MKITTLTDALAAMPAFKREESETLYPAPEFQWVLGRCTRCKCGIPIRSAVEDNGFSTKLRDCLACEDCVGDKTIDEVKIAETVPHRKMHLDRLVPLEYRKEIRYDFPGSSQRNHHRVMSWEYGPGVLWIHGAVGNCKTRYAFELCKREYVEHGREFKFGTHSDLRAEFLAAMKRDGGRDVPHLSAKFARVPLLFIDDFGKGKITDAHEEWMYAILNARYSRQLPTIFTAQISPTQAEAMFTEEFGLAIFRRISDQYSVVDFDS
jgi:hypothetical protein